jgi:peptide/nickel transport system permease protein
VPNPPTGPTGLLTVDGLLAGRFDVVTSALHHLILLP